MIKYRDHLPLYLQQERFLREDIVLPRFTLDCANGVASDAAT